MDNNNKIKTIYYEFIGIWLDFNTLLHDAVGKVHFAIFRTIDMTVGIGQTGKSLAEVRLRVTELLREGFRLVFQIAPGNPAGGGKRRLDGRAGFLIQFGMQGQSHAFFQSQGITDD